MYNYIDKTDNEMTNIFVSLISLLQLSQILMEFNMSNGYEHWILPDLCWEKEWRAEKDRGLGFTMDIFKSKKGHELGGFEHTLRHYNTYDIDIMDGREGSVLLTDDGLRMG